MERRLLGKTDLQVSLLGLGGAEIGFEQTDENTVTRIFDEAADAGVNIVDTAAMYGDSEEKIGRAIRGRRNAFHIFTKCGLFPPGRKNLRGLCARLSHRLARATGAGTCEDVSWRPSVLQWNIDCSLRRLGVDYVDVIQLHSCSEQALRRGEVVEAVQRAKEAGKARYIGYSGDGTAAVAALQSQTFDVLQTSVNIADQQAIEATIPLAAQYGVGVVAKRPVANQLWKHASLPDGVHERIYWERLQKLRYDFLSRDDSIETALRFTLSIAGVHTAIVGTTKPTHFRQNVSALRTGTLPKEAFETIRDRWRNAAQPSWVGQT